MYIGATLDEVREAIRTGKIRHAVRPRNPDVFESYDVRVNPPKGAGTRWLAGRRDYYYVGGYCRRRGDDEALTGPLASQLLPRWWHGGPGTKLVVGFRIKKDETWVLTPVVVTRPATPRTTIYRGGKYIAVDQRMTAPKIRDIFMEAFERAEGHIRWNSPLYVWPAGILDTRTSNAVNKTVVAWYKAIRERRERRELGRATSTKDRVAPVIERYRANLKRRATQHANLMAELRAVPKGALHPSFPGGSNYVASIARLDATRRESERNKKKKKRNNATNHNPRPKKRAA